MLKNIYQFEPPSPHPFLSNMQKLAIQRKSFKTVTLLQKFTELLDPFPLIFVVKYFSFKLFTYINLELLYYIYCNVLYCILQYFTVLYCTVQYCTVLYCTVQ